MTRWGLGFCFDIGDGCAGSGVESERVRWIFVYERGHQPRERAEP